jgi:cytochrome P450
MHAEVDGQRLSTQEFGSFFILLVAAGNETTRNAISHGMKALTDFPDERVLIWHISANRDEEIWDDPFVFDITRDPNPHVAFGGGGSHFCLGANLARTELRLILEELVRRMPDMQLAGEPDRLLSNFIGGIKHMPVKWTPGSRVLASA